MQGQVWRVVSVVWLVGMMLGAGVLTQVGAAPQATVADLKISEIQVGGAGGATDEFVELYNPTATAVTGLSSATLYLHIVSSTGTDVNKTLTFTSTTVPAYGHFLIGGAGYTGARARDASYATSSGALVQNGAVYISTSATANTGVVDLVGWGTNGLFEGTAFRSGASYAPPNGSSMERLPATSSASGWHLNNTDTNDNAADFQETSVANPENSASPTVVALSHLSARGEPAYERFGWLVASALAGAWLGLRVWRR